MTGVSHLGVVDVPFFEVLAFGTHPFDDLAPFEFGGPGHPVSDLAIDPAHDLAAKRAFLYGHCCRTAS